MIGLYNQLCPVLFGVDAVKEVGNKVREFGAKKILCVYDAGVKACGIAATVLDYLKAADLEVDVFEGVMPDAPDKVINDAGAGICNKGYDLIVGLGGGSSLDTAKSLTVLAEKQPPISNYYADKAGMNINEHVKLILIPTASGTGSEMTPISVVFDTERQVKDTVLKCGDLAIVDPMLTITSPVGVTSSSGMDAFSHALEAFTSNSANMKTDLLALEAMKLIYENLERACKKGDDVEARTALSFASNIAGIAFADASVHIGHCAAHEIGGRYHIPHGVLCALSVPAAIEFVADVVGDKLNKLAEILNIPLPGGCTSADAGKVIADTLRAFCKKVGIKSLKELGCEREDIISCAKGAIDNNWFVIKTPKNVAVEDMEAFIANMYDQY